MSYFTLLSILLIYWYFDILRSKFYYSWHHISPCPTLLLLPYIASGNNCLEICFRCDSWGRIDISGELASCLRSLPILSSTDCSFCSELYLYWLTLAAIVCLPLLLIQFFNNLIVALAVMSELSLAFSNKSIIEF